MGKKPETNRKRARDREADAGDGEALAARVNEGWNALVSRANRGAGRLREAARELRRPAALQHAVAARERGNLEAAFWLLTEAYGERPDEMEIAVPYWNVAVALERVSIAAPAGVALVERSAAEGRAERAAGFWSELVAASPETLVAPTALASLIPALRARLEHEDEEGRERVRALVRRAMRHAVDPRNERPTPGVALRLFEEGRDVNPEAARRAAEVALESPDLHEAKRARLRTWMDGRDPDAEAEARAAASAPSTAAPAPAPLPAEPAPRRRTLSDEQIAAAAARLPAAAPPPVQKGDGARPPADGRDEDVQQGDVQKGDGAEPQAPEPPVESDAADDAAGDDLEITPGVPIELGEDGLVVRLEDGSRTQIGWQEIEAVSVARVCAVRADAPDRAAEPDAKSVVIDLVLAGSRSPSEPVRSVRVHADAFDPEQLAPGACAAGEGLAAFLGEVLERSRAIPLPDPESALGLRLAEFESLAAYERAVLLPD